MANQNQRTNTYRRRENKVLNLIKVFNNFSDGYSELSSLVPEIKVYGGDTPMFDAVINSIMNVIRENTPSPENSNYPNTMSFSIDSHEVGVRTDGEMAFGWKSFYDRDNGEIKYRFRITFINPSTYRNIVIKKMKDENGWEELVIDKNGQGSRSRFWRTVENGGKTYNKRTREDRPGRKVAEADPPAEEEGTINPDIAEQLEGYKAPEAEEKVESDTKEAEETTVAVEETAPAQPAEENQTSEGQQ